MGQRIVPVTMGSPRFLTVELDGMRITDAEFAAGDVLPPHVHDRTVVAVMLQGSFDLAIRPRSLACTPGTVLVEPGGERHANRIGRAGARVLVIEPTPFYERQHLEACRRFLNAPVACSHQSAAGIAGRLRRELYQRDGIGALMLEELAVELIAVAAQGSPPREPRPVPPWLQRARDLVHETPLTPLRVCDVAAEVGVHPVYLTKAFRERWGTSLGSYQRRRRLEWAASRLAAGEPVAEVAHRAGFADQAHFTRAFKRFSGQTPGRFRVAAKQPQEQWRERNGARE